MRDENTAQPQEPETTTLDHVFGGEIPGAEYLGWGFDIFGTYDSRSALNRLLALPTSDKTFEDGGVSYLVPDDVTVKAERKSLGETQAFSSRSEVESYFSGQASVEGSYGAFQGQFEASYSQMSESDRKYMFALHRAGWRAWWLDVDNPSEQKLAAAVRSDPVYRDLPDAYQEADQWRFFAFFDKYGTHFVRKVEAGFHVYMTTWVLEEYSKNRTEIEGKMKLQYDAAFGGKAQAAAKWQQVGKNWSEASGTRIEGVGGDASLLEVIAVTYGANFEDVYKRWLASAERAPAAIGFQLAPVWQLFTPKKAEALKKAFPDYVRHRIYVESKSNDSLIMVRGVPLDAGKRPDPAHHAGFQVAILDRKTLEPVVSKHIAFSRSFVYSSDWQRAYDSLATLLAQHRAADRLLVLASWGVRAHWYPTGKLYQELVSFGAGRGLEIWHKASERAASKNAAIVNYILLGASRIGLNSGLEAVRVGADYNVSADMAVLDVPIQRAPDQDGEPAARLEPTASRRAA